MYYKMVGGNFGDDLNDWFWDRAAPGLLDQDGRAWLIGIGTILQHKCIDPIPRQALKIVIGAGSGSKGPLPPIDDSWRVYGVRGPLTASYYDLSPDKILTDPAMLVADFDEFKSTGARSGIGFMPHVWSVDDWDWRATCARLGLIYVDPRADSKSTITQISGLTRLVTEAMHGAIVADALRVPWVAAPISPRFEPTKWADWAGSLGVDVHFQIVPQLRRGQHSRSDQLKYSFKRLAATLGVVPKYIPETGSNSLEVALSERALTRAANDAPPQLSSELRFGRALVSMRLALSTLAEDVRSGTLITAE